MTRGHALRYFFHVTENGREMFDPVGSDLASDKEARAEALTLLGSRAKDTLPDGDHRMFVVDVLDERGIRVLTANLSMIVTYPDHGPRAH